MKIVKFWRKDCRVNISNLEDYFSFWSKELDAVLINSHEINQLDDEGLQSYKTNLLTILMDVNNKYRNYVSYYLSNSYNADYNNIDVRLSQLFLRVNREIQSRRRSRF